MATNILQTRLVNCAKSLSDWEATTTVPILGELCLEAIQGEGSDTNIYYKLKIGDGVQTYSNLPYFLAGNISEEELTNIHEVILRTIGNDKVAGVTITNINNGITTSTEYVPIKRDIAPSTTQDAKNITINNGNNINFTINNSTTSATVSVNLKDTITGNLTFIGNSTTGEDASLKVRRYTTPNDYDDVEVATVDVVDDAIDEVVETLDYTDPRTADTYIKAIDEVNGVINVVRDSTDNLIAGDIKDTVKIVDNTPSMWLYRTTGGSRDISENNETAEFEKIYGNSLVWNQLENINNGRVDVQYSVGTVTNVNGIIKVIITNTTEGRQLNVFHNFPQITLKAQHKYLVRIDYKGEFTNIPRVSFYDGSTYFVSNINANSIFTYNGDSDKLATVFRIDTVLVTMTVGDEYYFTPQLFDLTQMFGSDANICTALGVANLTDEANKTLAIQNFEKLFPNNYYPYNTGEILSFNGNKIKSVGFNLFDQETTLPQYGFTKQDDGSYYISDFTAVSSRIIFDNRKLKYQGQVRASAWIKYVNSGLPGLLYRVFYTDGTSEYFQGGTTSGKIADIITNSNKVVRTINFSYQTPNPSYIKDVLVHLCWSGYRNTDAYEPYTTNERELPISKINTDGTITESAEGKTRLFPNGLLSAGSVHDVVTKDGADSNIGVVDLGSLTWIRILGPQGDRYRYSGKTSSLNIKGSFNRLCTKFRQGNIVYDSNIGVMTYVEYSQYCLINCWTGLDEYESVADFKAAMQGVLLYYEKATPTHVTFTKKLNLIYQVDDYGTEEIIPNDVDPITGTPKTAPFGIGTIINYNSNFKDAVIEHLTTHDEVWQKKLTAGTNVSIDNDTINVNVSGLIDTDINNTTKTSDVTTPSTKATWDRLANRQITYNSGTTDADTKGYQLQKITQNSTTNADEFTNIYPRSKSDFIAFGNTNNSVTTELNNKMTISTYIDTETDKLKNQYLPSGLPSVHPGYLYNGEFYEESTHLTPIPKTTGDIYIDNTTGQNNALYIYSGIAFVKLDVAAIPLSGSAAITGSLTPNVNNANLGTTNYPWNNIYANTYHGSLNSGLSWEYGSVSSAEDGSYNNSSAQTISIPKALSDLSDSIKASVKVNGSSTFKLYSNKIDTPDVEIYAPITPGSSGEILISDSTSTTSKAPIWASPSNITVGTATKVSQILTIGNSGGTAHQYDGSAATTISGEDIIGIINEVTTEFIDKADYATEAGTLNAAYVESFAPETSTTVTYTDLTKFKVASKNTSGQSVTSYYQIKDAKTYTLTDKSDGTNIDYKPTLSDGTNRTTITGLNVMLLKLLQGDELILDGNFGTTEEEI